jgi:ribonuclease BN (tRNA processing enzyme)
MSIWVRKNGIGLAFSRELGCDCRRCTTVNYNLASPPSGLLNFDGWDDPPWRAHTSASLFFGQDGGEVEDHILIDCGAGVVDSLMASGLKGVGKVSALLITHWHPDHILSINQLCESLKRRGGFRKLPLYCTLTTYDWLRWQKGFDYECKRYLRLQEILPEQPFEIPLGQTKVRFNPLHVAHGSVEDAVIFVAEIETKKIVFGWDIDVPSAQIPDKRTNEQIIKQYLQDDSPDILFMASNTWKATDTGHTSYELAQHYIDIIKAKEVFLTHLSGHEDDKAPDKATNGYGWTDADWANAVQPNGHKVAKQGMIRRL